MTPGSPTSSPTTAPTSSRSATTSTAAPTTRPIAFASSKTAPSRPAFFRLAARGARRSRSRRRVATSIVPVPDRSRLPDQPGLLDPGAFDGPDGPVTVPMKLFVGDGPEVVESKTDNRRGIEDRDGGRANGQRPDRASRRGGPLHAPGQKGRLDRRPHPGRPTGLVARLGRPGRRCRRARNWRRTTTRVSTPTRTSHSSRSTTSRPPSPIAD